MRLKKKVFEAWCGVREAKVKAHRAAKRKRRDYLFKCNQRKFGREKAKMIACIVARKARGEFIPTQKSTQRYWRWKARQKKRTREEHKTF